MSVPSSVIHIIKGVPINNSYEHTLYFESELGQRNYFLGKKVHTFENFTYLRPDNVIKVAGDVANARTWSYLMFQNDSGKWYYHFINKVVYINDSAVELHIELDVIQTFMFDWQLHPCFIERTHTTSDEFGEHTVPEGLETGPLIRAHATEINLEDNYIIILMSCYPDGSDAWGQMYGGVYSGLQAFAVDPANISALNKWMTDNSTLTEAIVAMWMYPKKFVNTTANTTTPPLYLVTDVADIKVETVTDYLANATRLDGAIVQNKKTFCYPYTMLYVSNNMGGSAVYHREWFNSSDSFKFNLYGALSPDSGVQLTPKDYKTATSNSINFEESLTMPPFPSCAWNSDTYKIWLAQNQNTQETAMKQAKLQGGMGSMSAVLGVIGGLATGNLLMAGGALLAGGGSFISAQNQVENIMAMREDMSIQPDQARGHHSGNINLTHGRMGFTVYTLTITKEYVDKIDNYFTRYGYKVNMLATPSLKNRSNFTYIKTVGSLVTGNMGAEDQLKIQAIFDKGVTFWAKPDKIGNYTEANNTL